jgi:aminopeptidase N
LDNTNEDVVSHELFHQWFGDLVTCESWSNLTLNESFATYGEYLWNEFKYGQDKADHGLQNDLNGYIQQKGQKDPNLVRFDYNDKEDMFDGISYQKGGRILHMLRRYVGDDAFFESLKLYLTKNKFNSAEAHNLRLAFEEVTGEDLNWFFNQWYFNHGSPDLDIKTEYSDTTKKITVTIEQKQDFAKNPLFKLPLAIDVYNAGKPTQYKVTAEKAKEVFTFESATRPDFVNVDGEKSLLCTKRESKPAAEWIAMYKEGPLYMDRYEAIQNLAKVAEQNADAAKTILDATSDKFWSIRSLAIKNIGKILSNNKEAVKQRLMDIANNDDKPQVRAAAIRALVKNYDDGSLTDLYRSKLREQSYIVQGEALEALGKKQPAEAINLAKSYELEKNSDINRSVTNLYIDKGNDEQNTYFLGALQRLNGFALYSMLQSYGKFLARCSDETITRSLLPVEDIARKNSQWYVRLAAVGTLNDVMKKYEDKETDGKSKLVTLKTQNPKPISEIENTETQISDAGRRKDAVKSLIASIKKDEKDPQLMKIYGTAPEAAKDEKNTSSK